MKYLLLLTLLLPSLALAEKAVLSKGFSNKYLSEKKYKYGVKDDPSCEWEDEFIESPLKASVDLAKKKSAIRKECKRQLLHAFSWEQAKRRKAFGDYKDACEKKQDKGCARYKDMDQAFSRIIKSLADDMIKDYKMKAEDFDCRPEDDGTKWALQFKEMLKATKCKVPVPGSPLVVSKIDEFGSPTPVESNYTLVKESDGSTSILLNENIVAKEEGVDVAAERKKIRECFAYANPALNGPNGERLNFKLLDRDDLMALPPEHRPEANNITLTKDTIREDSENYSVQTDCPTIIHESLHLLGLVDEYHEHEKNWDFSCRTAPKTSTIMSDQNSAFRDNEGEEIVCECSDSKECSNPPDNDRGDPSLELAQFKSAYIYGSFEKYCQKARHPYLVNSKDIKNLPAGFPVTEKNGSSAKFFATSTMMGGGLDGISYGFDEWNCECPAGDEVCKSEMSDNIKTFRNTFKKPLLSACKTQKTFGTSDKKPGYDKAKKLLTMIKQPRVKSLLAPAHFEKIMGGNCPDKAKNYIACSQGAYEKITECKPKPQECSDDKYYLGLK